MYIFPVFMGYYTELASSAAASLTTKTEQLASSRWDSSCFDRLVAKYIIEQSRLCQACKFRFQNHLPLINAGDVVVYKHGLLDSSDVHVSTDSQSAPVPIDLAIYDKTVAGPAWWGRMRKD
jgi:hypothetical protein